MMQSIAHSPSNTQLSNRADLGAVPTLTEWIAGPILEKMGAWRERAYCPKDSILTEECTLSFDDQRELEELAQKSGYFRENLPLTLKAAMQGIASAQNALGDMYFLGDRLPASFKTAAYWYQKAFDQNDFSSAHELAFLYGLGLGVEKNPEKELKILYQCALNGDERCHATLGQYYEKGHSHLAPSQENAYRHYFIAARKNHPEAQFALGKMLFEGRGCEQNPSEAVRWIREAATTLPEAKLWLLARKISQSVCNIIR